MGDHRGSSSRGDYPGDQNKPMPETVKHELLIQQPLPPGSQGNPIDLIANFYKFTTTDMTFYHYDIEIKKKHTYGKINRFNYSHEMSSFYWFNSAGFSDTAEMNVKLERFIKKFSPNVVAEFFAIHRELFATTQTAYDGYKNLYTSKRLFKPKIFYYTVAIQVDNRPSEFLIKFTNVNDVTAQKAINFYLDQSTNMPERVISAYETMFRSVCGQSYKGWQRKLFFDFEDIHSSARIELTEFVQGFTSAVRLTEFGLAFNLHLKTTYAIHRNFTGDTNLTRIVSSIGKFKEGQVPNRLQLVDVNRFIRRLKMFTKHGERQLDYTIDRLSDMNPHVMKFTNRDGKVVSIAEYFEEQYQIQVGYWPLVKTAGRHARFIPMELCYLSPKQFLSYMKINTITKEELLSKSTHEPNVMFNKLDAIVKRVAHTDTNLQRGFGVSLEPMPVSFKGRVLDTPRQLCPTNRDKFHSVGTLPKRWAVLCFDMYIDQNELNKFVNQLMDRARILGLNFAEPEQIAIVDITNENSIPNAFHDLCNNTQAQFVFVGIPGPHGRPYASYQIYGLVKYHCDNMFGITSQCFSVDKMLQTPAGYFDSFLLKTNGKLGGLNSVLEPSMFKDLPFDTKKTMMIGIDVNYPENYPISSLISVAVGSLDQMYSQYTASIRVQKKDRDEILIHLDVMIEELLEEFKKTNENYPENLIIFRNGVSEDKFETVTKTELKSIEDCTNRLCEQMKITLIVTQKHHCTRFALTQEENTSGERPIWNVPSGTVVDTAIVDPKYKMFYLNSHFSPLGTSRPTKYVILRDDLNMTSDEVQRMTFLACFHSIRTRDVLAIPTPSRYAELCAYRAKLHIDIQTFMALQGIGPKTKWEQTEAETIQKLNDSVKVHEQVKNKLYYC